MMNWQIWLLGLYVCVLIVCTLITVRSTIVYNARMQKLDQIGVRAQADINDGKYDNWRKYYEEFGASTYRAMIFDLTKWTYKQFYPGRRHD